MIRIKRTYEPPARGDGRRILVERLWPRGMKKEAVDADAWMKDVAPSTGLRKWFDHRVERWEEFRRRYREELNANPDGCKPILDASGRGAGTNPEELLAAAHASCFAMALSLFLGKAGFKPEYVDATAHVTVTPQGEGFKITSSHLVCEASVPGIDQATFMQHAESAKAHCPVSQALAGTEITLEATLKATLAVA